MGRVRSRRTEMRRVAEVAVNVFPGQLRRVGDCNPPHGSARHFVGRRARGAREIAANSSAPGCEATSEVETHILTGRCSRRPLLGSRIGL